MPKPISSLNLFPTRSERLPGDAPFNPLWPPKDWADPNPKQAGRDLAGVPYAVYHVYVRFDEITHSPVFEDVSVPFPLAKATNIVPSNVGSTFGKLLPQCPTPVRALKDDEVVKPYGNPPIPMVYTAAELVVPKDPGQDFTEPQKELLLDGAAAAKEARDILKAQTRVGA